MDKLTLIDNLRKMKKTLPCTQEISAIDETNDIEYVLFVIDKSGSMASDDYPPSRFLAGCAAIKAFIYEKQGLTGETMFGLVVFDSGSSILCCNTHLSVANTELLGRLKRILPGNGTNIASGLYKAQSIINDFAQNYIKRIVLLTDGNGGDPLNIATKLKKENVVIDVIGIGGSHFAVNEPLLKNVASVVDGVLRYRFIGDRDNLVAHFTKIAGSLVKK